MWFSEQTFFQMMQAGWIVDGRGGGLVLGRSHAGGNIYMIQQGSDGRFHIPSHLEGGEYILNWNSYAANKSKIEEINKFKEVGSVLSEVKLAPTTRVLNMHAEPFDKLLWIDSRGQFIVNKRATAKFYSELDALNQCQNGFLRCDVDMMAPKEME